MGIFFSPGSLPLCVLRPCFTFIFARSALFQTNPDKPRILGNFSYTKGIYSASVHYFPLIMTLLIYINRIAVLSLHNSFHATF